MKICMLISCVLAVAMFQQVHAAPLLGENKCTWGPAYFCSNYSTLGECGITDGFRGAPSCVKEIREGLKRNSMGTDDTEVCTICKQTMAELEAYLNGTRKECKDELLAICKKLPVAALTDDCDAIVEKYYDAIVNDIMKALDLVCYGLGLCHQNVAEYIKSIRKMQLAQMTPQERLTAPFIHQIPIFANMDIDGGSKIPK